MIGIYVRISQEKLEGTDRSINDQTLIGINLSKQLKLDYKVYKDEGVSGTLPIDERPFFSELIDDIHSGIITKVFVYDQSRLERNPEVRFVIKKIFKENNIELYTESGKVDLDDEESEFFGDLISVINSYYVKMTKKKVKSVIKRNLEEGKSHGLPNFGYRTDDNGYMVIDEEESKIVKKIYDMNLKGIGQRKITEWLITNQVPNRRKNRKWGNTTVGHILSNEIYKGIRVVNDITYACPVIIEPKYWQKVQDNKNPRGRGNNYKYLLNHSLTCGKCGSRYTGRYVKQHNIYRCVSRQYKNSTCINRGMHQNYLEDFIWRQFFANEKLEKIAMEWIANPPIEKLKETQKTIIGIQKEIDSLNTKRKRAITLVIEGTLTKQDIKSELTKIDSKIKDYTIQLDNHMETVSVFEASKKEIENLKVNINQVFFDTSFELKQDLIRKWIKDIKIDFNNLIYTVTISINLLSAKQETFRMDSYYRWCLDESGESVWRKPKYPKLPKRLLGSHKGE